MQNLSMQKILWLAICGLLLSAVSAQAAGPDRAGIVAALSEYLRAASSEAEDALPGKAVPRVDKAEATFIGEVDFVSESGLLDDGTPWRLVVVGSRKPFHQFHYVACVGAAANKACETLRGRVQFTADVLSVQDGEDTGLALFVARKIKK